MASFEKGLIFGSAAMVGSFAADLIRAIITGEPLFPYQTKQLFVDAIIGVGSGTVIGVFSKED